MSFGRKGVQCFRPFLQSRLPLAWRSNTNSGLPKSDSAAAPFRRLSRDRSSVGSRFAQRNILEHV